MHYINPAYNSGDNLHPNDAGYQAMGKCHQPGAAEVAELPQRSPRTSP